MPLGFLIYHSCTGCTITFFFRKTCISKQLSLHRQKYSFSKFYRKRMKIYFIIRFCVLYMDYFRIFLCLDIIHRYHFTNSVLIQYQKDVSFQAVFAPKIRKLYSWYQLLPLWKKRRGRGKDICATNRICRHTFWLCTGHFVDI